MGKYTNLEKDIFSLFSNITWTEEVIKTFPSNFVTVNAGEEFIRINILPKGFGINLNSTSGVLLIDIFTLAGNGTKRTSLIADKLDSYLVGKSLSTESKAVTQFANSSLDYSGNDKDNPTLFRATYSIPFNFFGAL
jgi:hypothetical protein